MKTRLLKDENLYCRLASLQTKCYIINTSKQSENLSNKLNNSQFLNDFLEFCCSFFSYKIRKSIEIGSKLKIEFNVHFDNCLENNV